MSMSTNEFVHEKIFLHSLTLDADKRECGNIVSNAGTVKHVFPSRSCFSQEIKFYLPVFED